MSETLQLRIEYHSGIPVYRQIIQGITAAVEEGRLQDGDRLPTIRELSSALKVNPNTVAKAYREMELMHLLEGHGRNGSVINDLRAPLAVLSDEEKAEKLNQIYLRAVAEATAHQISEKELRERFVDSALTKEE